MVRDKSKLPISVQKNKKVKFIWLRPSLMFGPFDNRQRFLGSIFNSFNASLKDEITLSASFPKEEFIIVAFSLSTNPTLPIR